MPGLWSEGPVGTWFVSAGPLLESPTGRLGRKAMPTTATNIINQPTVCSGRKLLLTTLI